MKNKTFNRILTISIITIILLNWVFNYIVFSASTNETLEDIEITIGNVGQQYYIDIKRQAVEALRSQLEEKYNYKGTVEELAEICEIDLNNGTAIENISPSGKQIKIDEDTTIILGFDMSITTGADKSHSSEGTGIGLSIAWEIMKNLDENIYYESGDKYKSIFNFTIHYN